MSDQDRFDYEVTREMYEQQKPAIKSRFDPPAIPCRDFDWSAVREGYEPGDAIGWGSTQHAAVMDLLQEEDK